MWETEIVSLNSWSIQWAIVALTVSYLCTVYYCHFVLTKLLYTVWFEKGKRSCQGWFEKGSKVG
jgi:hypothetical protein